MNQNAVIQAKALATRELESCVHWRCGVCFLVLPVSMAAAIAVTERSLGVVLGAVVFGSLWAGLISLPSMVVYTHLTKRWITTTPLEFTRLHARRCLGSIEEPDYFRPALLWPSTRLCKMPVVWLVSFPIMGAIGVWPLVFGQLLSEPMASGTQAVAGGAYFFSVLAAPVVGSMLDRVWWLCRGRLWAAEMTGIDPVALMRALGYVWLWWYGWALPSQPQDRAGYDQFDELAASDSLPLPTDGTE